MANHRTGRRLLLQNRVDAADQLNVGSANLQSSVGEKWKEGSGGSDKGQPRVCHKASHLARARRTSSTAEEIKNA